MLLRLSLNLDVCVQKAAQISNKQEEQNQFHECSWDALTSLSSCSCHVLHVLWGFPCLFIISNATARDRESREFNRDGGTSRKLIIHGLRSLHFCAGALDGFDIPWWITTTKWGGVGGKKVREKQKTERENPGGILCLNSLGACSVLVEYCTFLWQAYLLSSTHATLSNRIESQRRSSFIQPECACSCAAHLLLIKQ